MNRTIIVSLLAASMAVGCASKPDPAAIEAARKAAERQAQQEAAAEARRESQRAYERLDKDLGR